MTQLRMFARLAKVDEEKRQVTGIIASETPDHAKEIFDYASSKPNFEAWSNTVSKASNGKSVGNLRAMHGNVVAGALEELVFDDVQKSIAVVANVLDDNEWNKVLKGGYTGFSIGGSYGGKWDDELNKGHKRYTAVPTEVSLVDVGCNPAATFTLCKANGLNEEVAFEQPTTDELLAKMRDAETPVEDLPLIAVQLAKAYEAAAAEPDPVKQDDEELAKGAYGIAELARIAQDAMYLATGYGCSINGVTSPFTEDVKKGASALYDGLLKMVGADVEEAKATLKGVKKAADDATENDLRKRADELTVVNATLAKVFAAHGLAADATHADGVELINKFIADRDGLTKQLDDTKAELAKVSAQPAPAKGVKTLVVGKEEDGLTKAADSATAEATDPLELMKAAHAKPGSVTALGRFNVGGG